MTFLNILLAIVVLILLLFGATLVHLYFGKARAKRAIQNTYIRHLSGVGTVDHLSILPLIDWYAGGDKFRTEPGVSYLIRADDSSILMDVGYNQGKEHPSPLLHNMRELDITPDGLDGIVLTHAHLDHLGGMREQKNREFSVSQGSVSLRSIQVYTPVPITPSKWNPEPHLSVVREPAELWKGIVSTGPLPRFLYLLGYTEEQSLIIRVANKGLVIIIGCGHPTIERIIGRARVLFDDPVYAVIGGLHYPVHGGRVYVGPLNVQRIVGADRPPWHPINEQDVFRGIDAIREVNPKIVALSPHDSSDWSLNQFREAFGERYRDIKVGEEIFI